MDLLVLQLLSFILAASSAPQQLSHAARALFRYSAPPLQNTIRYNDRPQPYNNYINNFIGSQYGYSRPLVCPKGQVLSYDGRTCHRAVVTNQFYLFEAPPIKRPQYRVPLSHLPKPKIVYDIIVVKIPEKKTPKPIVIPKPHEQTVVYVLNERAKLQQHVIKQLSAPPTEPEVYFINYKDGENPTLPHGGTLESFLNSGVLQKDYKSR